MTARGPYEDPKSTPTKWVVVFVLLSLLAHVIIIAAILLITVFMPVPKIVPPNLTSPNVTLSLEPPPTPKPPPAPVLTKSLPPLFANTTPETNAQHKEQPIQSANDHDLTTLNKTARAPDSLAPDVTGKKHGDLNTLPDIHGQPKPEVSSTPPTPKQAQPEKPTPPQPKPQQGQQTPSQPPQPTPRPPTPPRKAEPAVDPLTGLPVLPPLNAPTMAPPKPESQSHAPTSSQLATAEDVYGAVGLHGKNSPATKASVLGKYAQKVSLSIGSRCQIKIAGVDLPVGMVEIEYAIHADGTVDTKVINGGGNNMQTFLSICLNSIREAAPYDKFDDYPGLRQELIKQYGGDGSVYVVDETFSLYEP